MTTNTKRQPAGSGESTVVNPLENVGLEAESKKLPSSQYKGVVPQPNCRWGAQIYEKHQRVWLGTFNQESAAAKAYDIAAQRFRGRDAVTNFEALSESDETDLAELEFLEFHSKAEIVDMLRKHTYGDELLQKKYTSINSSRRGRFTQLSSSSEKAVVREHLFEKTVTPSDVGKLNRLVIPKQHAEKHLPLQNIISSNNDNGILLNFEDENGKVWRFRYSYWNSSQSYVLTKGWSRFVKEKSLQAGDVVSFQQYYLNDQDKNEKQLYIDCKPRAKPTQVVRLFGVNIFKVESLENNNCWNNNISMNSNGKKRSSSSGCSGDLDLFLKKQCGGAL